MQRLKRLPRKEKKRIKKIYGANLRFHFQSSYKFFKLKERQFQGLAKLFNDDVDPIFSRD